MRNRSRLIWGAIAAAVIAAVYFAWTAFAPAEATQPRLLVNEVLYLPATDRPAFVEIFNAGRARVDLDGVSLRTAKNTSFTLPSGNSLDAGGFVIVRFDGLTGSEGGVVHAPTGAFPGGDRGAIWLTTPEGTVDGVAWGINRPAAVELCRGGRCSDPVPGSVVARIPGETTALTTIAWATLDPENATPGKPNSLPPVSAIAALPGTIFFGPPRFSWYSVAGAVRYRIEVATDESFARRVHEADVAAMPLSVLQQLTATGPELPPGDYFWRVQAVGARGDAATFSPPVAFSIRAKTEVPRSAYLFGVIGNAYADTDATSPTGAADPNAVCPNFITPSNNATCKELPVPVIAHQKDTGMLTLEAPSEEPPMGWDKPDVAGYPYCARAGVAMVNAYYHRKFNIPGKLSQDRLGYEAFKDVLEFPEYDLPVVGITDDAVSKRLLPLAFGTEGEFTMNGPTRRPVERVRYDFDACDKYEDDLNLRHCAEMGWAAESKECGEYRLAASHSCPGRIAYAFGVKFKSDLEREIDAGRPVIATYPNHLFLVVGYAAEHDDVFYIIYQDAGGRKVVPVTASSITDAFDSYWTVTPVKVGTDERSIAQHSDDDGVVDFDEVERFETNPQEPDSDGDGVNDKDEIHYSVWDVDHGYHKSVVDLENTVTDIEVTAAAKQAFREPMEFLKDSDDGGCTDGKENANHNGVRDSGETSNFVKEDDDCGPPPLGGHVHMDYAYGGSTCVGRVTIDTRFALNPQVVPGAPNIITTFSADEMTYDIRTDGCEDLPGDSVVYTFDHGFHLSGTTPLTTDNLGFAVFTPSWPEFSMQLPYALTEIGAANSLKGSYTGSGGGPWPADTYVAFTELKIQGNPVYCTDPTDSMYARPEDLDFCTDPTPCADQSNFPMDCLSEPQKYYVLPFNKSFRWNANEPGKYLISDVALTVDICDGCGN